MNRFFVVVLMGAAGLVCIGCTDPNVKLAREIKNMPPQQQREALAKLPGAKQLDVYLAARAGEPGINFAGEIASNWKSVLPALAQRLPSQRGPSARMQLLWLLAAISDECSLTKRDDVLAAASEAIGGLGEYKQYGEAVLTTIIHPAKPLPPCQSAD